MFEKEILSQKMGILEFHLTL